MKIRLYLFTLLTIIGSIAYGEDYTATIESGMFKYGVKSDGTATVLGLVSGAGMDNSILSIPESFTSEDVDYRVTALASDCFRANYNVTKVELPGSVTSIGESCFLDCQNLTEINLPEGLTSIEAWTFGSTAIQEIEIPSTVISIGNGAFMGCGSLNDINLSNSRYIGSFAFAGCTGLKYITIPESVEMIGGNAFMDSGIIYLALNTYKYVPFYDFTSVFGKSPVEFISAPSVATTFPGTYPNLFNGCPTLFYGRGVIDIDSEYPMTLTIPGIDGRGFELQGETSLIVKCEPREEYDTRETGIFVKPVYLSLILPETSETPKVTYQGESVKLDKNDNSFALFYGEEVEDGLKFPDNLPLNKLLATDATGIESIPSTVNDGQLKIYDTTGKIIGTLGRDGSYPSNMAKGIYLLRSGNVTRKVMVK